ncbi:hypothetical protein ACHWQZ_G012464 [Mnemiopsis leidyi]
MMCIGQASATDENVQSDQNVPSPGRKRPRFRATSTKMSYIPSKACQAQGRKRPRLGSARTKTSHIPISKQCKLGLCSDCQLISNLRKPAEEI